MAVKEKEMHLLRPSKLREVQESKHKGEVKSREQNIEKSVNISSLRKTVLSVPCTGRPPIRVVIPEAA